MNRKVQGITNGAAYFGKYREGNAIVVWLDSAHCKMKIYASWDKTRNCVKYEGYAKSLSGRKVNIECYVEERMKGSMTINGETYDLANGSLFLICLRSTQIEVGQINQDIFTITSKGKALRQLAEDVPEIRAFFEAAAEE